MIERLLIRLRRYDTLSDKEEQALRSAMGEVVTFDERARSSGLAALAEFDPSRPAPAP